MTRKSLEHRKAGIERNKSKINFQTVANYALRIRDHLLDLFGKNMDTACKAISWKSLPMDERKAHLSQVYGHMSLGNRPANLKLGGRHELGKDVLGAATENDIIIYDSVLESDDYDQVIDVLSHENTHNCQQNKTETTLSKDVVDVCGANYIMPDESVEYYVKNPIEKEAWLVGQIVGRHIRHAIINKVSGRAA